LGPAFDPLPLGELAAAAAGGAASTLAILLVDLIPRSLAVAHPEGWALRVAVPTRLAARLVAPMGRGVLRLVDLLLAPLGARATFRAPTPALEDIERFLTDERVRERGPDS